MLTLGRRDESDDPAALILACHARIRGFLAAAARLASDAPAPAADVASTAAAIARYFRLALPLHEADEDRSIAPRLADAGAEVARTLVEIAREHAELAAPIAGLIAACDHLAVTPGDREPARRGLGDTVAALGAIFARHLAREEAVMVPALAALPASARAAIQHEMRQRRA